MGAVRKFFPQADYFRKTFTSTRRSKTHNQNSVQYVRLEFFPLLLYPYNQSPVTEVKGEVQWALELHPSSMLMLWMTNATRVLRNAYTRTTLRGERWKSKESSGTSQNEKNEKCSIFTILSLCIQWVRAIYTLQPRLD